MGKFRAAQPSVPFAEEPLNRCVHGAEISRAHVEQRLQLPRQRRRVRPGKFGDRLNRDLSSLDRGSDFRVQPSQIVFRHLDDHVAADSDFRQLIHAALPPIN